MSKTIFVRATCVRNENLPVSIRARWLYAFAQVSSQLSFPHLDAAGISLGNIQWRASILERRRALVRDAVGMALEVQQR